MGNDELEKNNMVKDIFKKTTRLNFILSCFIVFLHSQCMDLLSSRNMLAGRIMQICMTIGDASVPTFFMVSAFLFYRDFEIKKYAKKLKSRTISILCPYVLWNIIFGITYMIMYWVPPTRSLVLEMGFSFDLMSFMKGILWSSYNTPLWFLRVLFFYVIVAPLFLVLLSKKWVSITVLSVVTVLNIIAPAPYSSALYWFPVYFIGAYLGKYYFIQIADTEYSKKQKMIAFACFTLLVILAYSFNPTYTIYRYCVPILCWIIFDFSKRHEKANYKWENFSFIIYCMHGMVIRVVKKFLTIGEGYFIANENCNVLVMYFGTGVITICLICIIGMILKKYFPFFYNFLIGGRVG